MNRVFNAIKNNNRILTALIIVVMMLVPFTGNISPASAMAEALVQTEALLAADGPAPFGTISIPSDSLPFSVEKSIRLRELIFADGAPMPAAAASTVRHLNIVLSQEVVPSMVGAVLCGIDDPKTVQKRE